MRSDLGSEERAAEGYTVDQVLSAVGDLVATAERTRANFGGEERAYPEANC